MSPDVLLPLVGMTLTIVLSIVTFAWRTGKMEAQLTHISQSVERIAATEARVTAIEHRMTGVEDTSRSLRRRSHHHANVLQKLLADAEIAGVSPYPTAE